MSTSTSNREKWSSENVPSGYPTKCNSDQIKEVVQDLSEEKTWKLQGGKNNVIWEKIINGHIESGQKELSLRREKLGLHEGPFGVLALTVVGGLIVAFIVYQFGWNGVASNSSSASEQSYICESGAYFTIKFVNADRIQINAENELNTYVKENSGDERIEVYGSESHAFTFTSGDLNQLIFTIRGEGPRSTICNATN